MKPNPLGDSHRAACSGERGGSPAAQEPTLAELVRRLETSLALLTAELERPQPMLGGLSAQEMLGGTP
jgi:hypothetical protein